MDLGLEEIVVDVIGRDFFIVLPIIDLVVPDSQE